MSRAAELSLVHHVREPRAPSDRPPALILLHGVGSNERSMASIAPAFDPRLLVVSARSPIVLGPESFAWFHVTFTPQGPVIDADEAMAGWRHIAAFIDEVVAAYGADPARVYLGGFSQGAIMSLATLLTAPERVAGVVALSGRLLPEVLPHAAPADALRDKPVLILHGLHDEKLDIRLARWAREQLAHFPLQLDYEELEIGHRIAPEAVARAGEWVRGRIDGLTD